MTAIPDSHVPDGAHHPAGHRPWCPFCSSDASLMIESIVSLSPTVPGVVEIEYSCAACDSFYAHAAKVEQIAKVLNGVQPAGGVLRFGHSFIHCGEPMEVTDLESVRIHADISDVSRPATLPDVSLSTRILRCQCGFRLAIPN